MNHLTCNLKLGTTKSTKSTKKAIFFVANFVASFVDLVNSCLRVEKVTPSFVPGINCQLPLPTATTRMGGGLMPSLRNALLCAFCLCWTSFSWAAELRSARLLTKPEHIFVNQSFELFFELEVSVGAEVQDLQFIGFASNDELFRLGSFEALPKIQRQIEGGKVTVDVLRFKAVGQALGVGAHPIQTRLQCQLLERQGGAFFSSYTSRGVQAAVPPFVLRIQALPETGKPIAFSGAVGKFTLSAQLSTLVAQPGDILTLTTIVQGEGDLRPAIAPLPQGTTGFKIYPLKEVAREMSLLRTEQIFIPQSTNAVEIGAITFSYFNPETRSFEVAKAGPFKIRFTEKSAQPATTSVRLIETATPVSRSEATAGQGVLLEQVNKGLHDYLCLVIPSAGLLLACFIFFQLQGTHTRLGVVLAIGVTLLSIGLGTFARRSSVQQTLEIHERTMVRFAPSTHAKTLFVLQPGTTVVPLETAGSWKRVDAKGERGWIEMPARRK
jgi:hypothetical protein